MIESSATQSFHIWRPVGGSSWSLHIIGERERADLVVLLALFTVYNESCYAQRSWGAWPHVHVHCTLYMYATGYIYVHVHVYIHIRVHVDLEPISLKTQARLAVSQDVVRILSMYAYKFVLSQR